jgi:hypothetical protein
MSEPQPLPGPAISGAFLTIGETTYFRHGGLWVPLDVPRLDWSALADAAFERDDDEPRALVSPPVIEREANRWMGAR